MIDGYTGIIALRDGLRKYIDMRRAKGKPPPTAHAMDLVWKHLHDYSKGSVQDMLLILEKSVINGWTDVFPLREGAARASPSSPPKQRFRIGSLSQAETPEQRRAKFAGIVE